jgi:hypothetical protein
MKLTMLIFMLLGLSSLSFAQSPTPATTTMPKGVPSNENPLRELKPSKKKIIGNNHQKAKVKIKKKKQK